MAQRKRTTRRRSSKGSGRTGIFLACWLLVAISLVILFFAKKDDIMRNVKNTQSALTAHDASTQKSTPPEKDEEVITITPPAPQKAAPSAKKSEEAPPQPQQNTTAKKTDAQKTPALSKKSTNQQNSLQKSDAKPDNAKPASKEVAKLDPKAPVAKMNVSLCFVVIDGDGRVARKVIRRSVDKSVGVLGVSLRELLRGPDGGEAKAGATTLIPSGTRLLGASIKNGIATINLSEDFAYNGAGVDGYLASLMQIVYTATEFSSVSRVQILIGGEKRDYLGSDGLLPGLYIGAPLTRSGF